MNFRTKYDYDGEKYISPSGQPTLDDYEYRVDKAGVKSLVMKEQKIDVQGRIDADYPSTDINLLMKRFALGDSSAIDVKEGFYADVSKMPKSYAELFDRVEMAKQYFDELPADLKSMFNNNYMEFFTEFDSKEFNEKIDKYNDRFVNHQFEEERKVEDNE